MQDLNGLAGFAALINSLILWPIIRDLKKVVESVKSTGFDHEKRIISLEVKVDK
jgi:hypothetical protein